MGDRVGELLHRLLDVQQRRAAIYSKLQAGFAEYLDSKSEIAYKNLCETVTGDFNSCSREVMEIECALKDRERNDLAALVRTLQSHEKTKLQMTATLQVLRRVGHPSERNQQDQHHRHDHHQQGAASTCALNCSDASGAQITGLEECVAEAEYLAAQKEAVKGIQEAVLSINDLMDTLRYEILED